MTLSKSCPRCHGYMYANRDMYGEYRECLHCGYMEDIVKPNNRTTPPPHLLEKEIA